MKYSFPAILKKDKYDENVLNVTFPDLLGVYTFGTNRDEALLMAQDVLKETLLSVPALRNVVPTSIEKVKTMFADAVLVEVEF